MWEICLGLLLILGLFLFFRKPQRCNYEYLGPYYTLGRANSYPDDVELNEECLFLEGDRHCMMTDGREGKCVLSGHCVPTMMTYGETVTPPYCTAPYFKEGCPRYCKCQQLRGEKDPNCLSNCRSMFP